MNITIISSDVSSEIRNTEYEGTISFGDRCFAYRLEAWISFSRFVNSVNQASEEKGLPTPPLLQELFVIAVSEEKTGEISLSDAVYSFVFGLIYLHLSTLENGPDIPGLQGVYVVDEDYIPTQFLPRNLS